jgi:hypothetical protein
MSMDSHMLYDKEQSDNRIQILKGQNKKTKQEVQIKQISKKG